ncbi:MAG: hypothetical protein R3185_07550, partial [Candidatus Thermoplasmatota archaeon]|nr:hypothetical protein [Candidatus Thermoplasmatota archaeon]
MTAAHGPSASRLGLLLLTLAFLALPLAAGQGPGLDGLDPGRTGALSFEGPATNDTAFQVRLPGAAVAQTVVHEGHAYIATTEATFWREDLNTSALWRIDLTSGDVEKLMDIPEGHLAYLVTPTFVILDET